MSRQVEQTPGAEDFCGTWFCRWWKKEDPLFSQVIVWRNAKCCAQGWLSWCKANFVVLEVPSIWRISNGINLKHDLYLWDGFFYRWISSHFFRFGDGYSLTLRCNLEKDVGKVERYMRKVFSFAVLKVNRKRISIKIPMYIIRLYMNYVTFFQEKHHSSLHYEIASQHVSLDDIFQKMEIAVKDMPILDYSVSQNTLDNVCRIPCNSVLNVIFSIIWQKN